MFMKELIKQTLKLKNIPKIPRLINTYFDNVETNIPKSAILKGAMAAKKINMENMVTNTIPGEGQRINGGDYWIFDVEETESIVREMFGDYLLGQ
ncbi:MAG: hypothetical protein GX300_06820 [Tissierellia bacterium]|nr:hypothetical protein [Tissierellia bacterium]